MLILRSPEDDPWERRPGGGEQAPVRAPVRRAPGARGAPYAFRSAYGARTRPPCAGTECVRSAFGACPGGEENLLLSEGDKQWGGGVSLLLRGAAPSWVWAVLPPPPEGGIPVGASFPRGAVCSVSRYSRG